LQKSLKTNKIPNNYFQQSQNYIQIYFQQIVILSLDSFH